MEKENQIVTTLRDDIRRRQEVIQHIAALEEQLGCDRICGSWLSSEGTLTASIRLVGMGTYRMLIYNNTLCYKRLVQDTIITLRRHRLLFGQEADEGVNRVQYNAAEDRLTLGCYGSFVPEDATYPFVECEQDTPNCFDE